MGRPLRYLESEPNCDDWSLVEVTTRTIQGRALLRPSREFNDLVRGVLGRGLATHPGIRMVAFSVLSNHYILLLLVRDAGDMAAFMRFVNAAISRGAGRLHHWPGPLWGRRYRHIQVLDDQAAVERLRYVLAHGVKETLVQRAAQWPGAMGLPALLHGATLRGTWVDRAAEYEARRQGKKVKKGSFTTTYIIELVPLPCWRDLSEAQRRHNIEEMVASIEEEARLDNIAHNRKPLGVRRILAQDPHAIVGDLVRTPAPSCHASSKARRRSFLEGYRAYVDAFRRAATEPQATTRFPAGSFPPGRPFVPLPRAASSSGP